MGLGFDGLHHGQSLPARLVLRLGVEGVRVRVRVMVRVRVRLRVRVELTRTLSLSLTLV